MKMVVSFITLFCFIVSFSMIEKDEAISIGAEQQVGMNGASTNFSIYNTSPESPDGAFICFVRYNEEPTEQRKIVSGELWICTRDLKKYRKLTDVNGLGVHNGTVAQWVDNSHIAFCDKGIIRVVDIRNGKDILKKKVETAGLGHDSSREAVLFAVSEQHGEGAPGMYELNCITGEIKSVKLISDCAGVPLPAYINREDILPVKDWRVTHLQYSPDGEKIAFRIDIGTKEGTKLLGICNRDGSNLNIRTKSLHFLWYGNESIAGHIQFDENGNFPPQGTRFQLMQWDLNGKYMVTLSPHRANHLTISPDLKYFVSETFYQTNPVIMYLSGKDRKDRITEIDRFKPYDIVWRKKFHTNPAFSRNGKRIYYSKPLNEKYNGTFYREIKYE